MDKTKSNQIEEQEKIINDTKALYEVVLKDRDYSNENKYSREKLIKVLELKDTMLENAREYILSSMELNLEGLKNFESIENIIPKLKGREVFRNIDIVNSSTQDIETDIIKLMNDYIKIRNAQKLKTQGKKIPQELLDVCLKYNIMILSHNYSNKEIFMQVFENDI